MHGCVRSWDVCHSRASAASKRSKSFDHQPVSLIIFDLMTYMNVDAPRGASLLRPPTLSPPTSPLPSAIARHTPSSCCVPSPAPFLSTRLSSSPYSPFHLKLDRLTQRSLTPRFSRTHPQPLVGMNSSANLSFGAASSFAATNSVQPARFRLPASGASFGINGFRSGANQNSVGAKWASHLETDHRAWHQARRER
jgi:hypothetical protein